jgi:general secretion pathway protein G
MILRRDVRKAVRSGFTLMEILVVVAIIVVLAGVGGYYLLPRVDEAKEKTALSQVKGPLTMAAESYKLNNDSYPPSLEALTQAQPNGGQPLLERDALLDPWSKPYRYDAAGTNNGGLKPDIWADGPNGPIGNWSKR